MLYNAIELPLAHRQIGPDTEFICSWRLPSKQNTNSERESKKKLIGVLTIQLIVISMSITPTAHQTTTTNSIEWLQSYWLKARFSCGLKAIHCNQHDHLWAFESQIKLLIAFECGFCNLLPNHSQSLSSLKWTVAHQNDPHFICFIKMPIKYSEIHKSMVCYSFSIVIMGWIKIINREHIHSDW